MINTLTHWTWRYLPWLGSIDPKVLKEERDKVKLYPDEYGFLHEYQLNVMGPRKSKPFIENTMYLQFYFDKIEKPKDEYWHWKTNDTSYFQLVCFYLPWEINII